MKGASGLATLRDVVLIVAIFAYFSGFSYYTEVLGQFGLASNIVQFPFYDTLAYSFAIFNHFSWLDIFIAIAVVIAVWLFAVRVPDTLPSWRVLKTLALVGVVSGVFWLIHNLAYNRAQDFTFGERVAPDNFVTMVVKPSAKKKYGKDFVFLNQHQHLTMLFQTADTYYVLSQFSGAPDFHSTFRHADDETVYLLPHGFIFAIPKSDVQTVITVLPKENYNEKD